MMETEKFERVYETLCGWAWEEYAVPGLENVYREGSVCSLAYDEIVRAYERLKKRLNVVDEDPDIEIILGSYHTINREIARKMFEYGRSCR